MSTTLRRTWLRVASAVGVRRFIATSGLGYRFVCHLGDFLGENPFYNRAAFRIELEICAAWLRQEKHPVVFDVGAHVGFWSTHLAQMLSDKSPEIFAFEPVPSTVRRLVESVELLGLSNNVHVVAAAVREKPAPVRLSYSEHKSLFAQVTTDNINPRAGEQLIYASGLTLDEFSSVAGVTPTFIKIDVEGSELSVLSGMQGLLKMNERPPVMFEFNPCTLSETSADPSLFRQLLEGYDVHYVDDFESPEGQKRPLGDLVGSIEEIGWVCNLFAVPSTQPSKNRWIEALALARRSLKEDAK